MNRRRHKLEVSTFPFLAVLLCTMGSLILVLLVMDRKSKRAAALRVQQTAQRQVEELTRRHADVLAENARRQQQARQAWEEARQLLHARLENEKQALANQAEAVQKQKKDVSSQVEDELAQLSLLRRELEAEKARLLGEQNALAQQRQQVTNAQVRQQQEQQSALARMSAELILLEQTLKDLNEARRRDVHTYSVIPYKGKNGESRRPLYVECASDKVLFHPDRFTLEPFQQVAIRAEVERRIARQREQWARLKVSPDELPYLMLLVRPDGMVSYYRLQQALVGLDVRYGYELIDPDWLLDFPAEDQAPEQRWMIATPSTGAEPIKPVPGGQRPLGVSRNGYRLTGESNSATGVGLGKPGASGAESNGLIPPAADGVRGTGPFLPGGWSGGQKNGVPGAEGTGRADGSGTGPGGNGVPQPGPSGQSGWPGQGTGLAHANPGSANVDGTLPGKSSGTPRASGPASASGALLPPGQSGTPSDAGDAQGTGVAADGLGRGAGSGTGPPGNGLRQPNQAGQFGWPGQGTGVARANPGPANVDGTLPGKSSGTSGASGAGLSNNTGAATQPSQAGQMTSAAPNGDPGAAGSPGPVNAASSNASSDSPKVPAPGPESPGAGPSRADPNASTYPGIQSPPTSGQESNVDSEPQGKPPRGAVSSAPDPIPVPSNRPRRPVVMRPARIGGDRDWPIFVECQDNAVVVYPSRQVLSIAALTQDASNNPLLQTIRQMIDRRQAAVPPGELPYRPQVRFLLRPEFERTFHLVYPSLQTLGVPVFRQTLSPKDDVWSIVAEE